MKGFTSGLIGLQRPLTCIISLECAHVVVGASPSSPTASTVPQAALAVGEDGHVFDPFRPTTTLIPVSWCSHRAAVLSQRQRDSQYTSFAWTSMLMLFTH